MLGRVVSDPTVSRLVIALAADARASLPAINAARAAARRVAWRAASDHITGAGHPLIVDIDASLVTAHSNKEQAEPGYK